MVAASSRAVSFGADRAARGEHRVDVRLEGVEVARAGDSAGTPKARPSGTVSA